jgi:putative solute:sodium symporter small subunit
LTKVLYGCGCRNVTIFHRLPARQQDRRGAAVEGPRPAERRRHHNIIPARCRVPVDPREGFESMATSDNDNAHWKKTTRLMFMHLGLWLFFGYIVHMFVHVLNKVTIPILGFPLGFYMAAQGSLIAFVVMLFFFARQQDNIDREFGVAEDD